MGPQLTAGHYAASARTPAYVVSQTVVFSLLLSMYDKML
jgi:hypothetical protein